MRHLLPTIIVAKIAKTVKFIRYRTPSERDSALRCAYQQALTDASLSAEQRRTKARAAVMHIGQITSAMTENDPVAHVAAYAEELAQSTGAPPEVERLRSSRAAGLRALTALAARPQELPPQFPAQAGVSDTLAFAGHFLPIALIVAAVELVLPLALGRSVLDGWGAKPPFFVLFSLRKGSTPKGRDSGSVHESPVRREADAPSPHQPLRNRPTKRPKDEPSGPFHFPLIYDIVIESQLDQPAKKAAT